MELNNAFSSAASLNAGSRMTSLLVSKDNSAFNTKDGVAIGGDQDKNLDELIAKMKDLKTAADRKVSPATGGTVKPLMFYPVQDSKVRHQAPVVIVHGTMATEKSVEKYKEAAHNAGYPLDLSTYASIKEGKSLEESGQVISREVNETRLLIAQKNLKTLSKVGKKPGDLEKFFMLEGSLFGEPHPSTKEVAALLPGIVKKMNDIVGLDREDLLENFSSYTKLMEEEIAEDIRATGFGSWMKGREACHDVCHKAALEIMDCIAPRAALVGHSMGGFLAYTLALNPKESMSDNNRFHYDAGNGISTVLTLSSPVGKGVNRTLPIGLSTLGYEIYDQNVLKMMEGFPGTQFFLMNPFIRASYEMNKEMMKEYMKSSAELMAFYTNPLTYLKSPGFAQITEDSDFIKEFVEGKNPPKGVTVISASCKDDGICEQDRAQLDDSVPNAHNLDAHVTITEEDLKTPMTSRWTWGHLKMAQYPFEHQDEFRKEILENPLSIPRVLDRSNSDGVRWNCLQVLLEDVSKDHHFFDAPEMKKALNAIKAVADEKLPFRESPSYVAKQIVDIVTGRSPGKETPAHKFRTLMLTRDI